jgi:hypothetical protein
MGKTRTKKEKTTMKKGGYTYSRKSARKSRKSNIVEKPYPTITSPYKPKPLPVVKK